MFVVANLYDYVITVVFGLLIGSFLNVCIYRIPEGLSIVRPGSRCPSCGTPISPFDNIPVLSYIFLLGKCRHCGKRISPRYPFVEALNAALYIAVLHRYGLGWHVPVYLALVSALIVITFIDLDHWIIPDVITLPGIVIGLLAGSLLLPDPFLRALPLGPQASFVGAALGYCLYYAVRKISSAVLKQEAMGGGDVKLMAMLGGFLGWKAVLLTTFAGSLLGSVLGIVLMLFLGKSRKLAIPFGPFLAVGALISLLWGQDLLYWYVDVGR